MTVGSPTRLSAGALTATLDGPDLTHIRLGGVEIVRRVLVTVRDVNWDTLRPDVLRSSLSVDPEHFQLELEGEHVAGEMRFRWQVFVRGDATGRLLYRLDGVAASEFLYNRIGLCVLHPVWTCAGAAYRASAADGSQSGVMDTEITPQVVEDGIPIALFAPCDALELMPAGGGTISFRFAGDLFEMEDQRNWTDDSFKTYCTPASLGAPHAASEGQRIQQTVEVRTAGLDIAMRKPEGPIAVSIGAPLPRSVPSLGLAMDRDLNVPNEAEVAILRRLSLAHVRADIELGTRSLDDQVLRAVEACARVGGALELALHLEPTDDKLLARLEAQLRTAKIPLARVLAFHREARSETPRETSSAELVQLVRRRLSRLAAVGGGTNMDFAELNRTRPDPAAGDIVAWSANAQVHASDDVSVMETLSGQAATVASARSFCGRCKLAVGPITLRPRFNPAATGPPLAHDPTALPAHVDPRQGTRFCAAWTAGSVATLAAAGVDSLTYFELVGMAGVMQEQTRAADPGSPAVAGLLFPVYHVFRALTQLSGRPLLRCEISAPGKVSVVATAERIVVSNLTPIRQRVVIEGLPWPAAGERDSDTERGTMIDSSASAIDLEPYGVKLLEASASARLRHIV
jgi:D-apionolactonase